MRTVPDDGGRSAGDRTRRTAESRSPVRQAGPDDFAELVLDVVDRIPPGHVMSYGDVAEMVGRGGPRQVGRVMAIWGGGVPWWRVIRADGGPPPGHERRAMERYRQERTPLRPDGARVDMRLARWDGLPRRP